MVKKDGVPKQAPRLGKTSAALKIVLIALMQGSEGKPSSGT